MRHNSGRRMPQAPKSPTHHHHHQADSTERIVAEAEERHPDSDVKLNQKERRHVAEIVVAERKLKGIPPSPTPAEREAKKRLGRVIHQHTAEVTEALGETHGKMAIDQAKRETAGGVDVAEIADALRALRVPNLGRMCDHLAPPPRERGGRRGK